MLLIVHCRDEIWSPIQQTIKYIKDTPISTFKSRGEINNYLKNYRMSNKLRSFITSSTRIINKKFNWNFDIELIDKYLYNYQTFPEKNNFNYSNFNGNILLLKCNQEKSKYINDNDLIGIIII